MAAKKKPETSETLDVCKKCGQVHVKCTAHKKHKVDGKYVPCNQNIAKGSRTKKCRLHGGLTPKGMASPHFKTGEQTRDGRYRYLPQPMAQRVEEMAEDELVALAQNARMQRALESRWHEALGTGNSPDAWKALGKVLDRLRSADTIAVLIWMPVLDMIVRGGLGEISVENRILEMHEAQRKMTDTLTKCRKDIAETITLDLHNQILLEFVEIVRKHVQDRATLSAIDADVRQRGVGIGSPQASELPVPV